MGIHTTDAIVLRCYPYRETSVIVSCLTDQFGKIKGLIKGLRVHPNRHRSAMEPLTVNRIVFYDTRASQLHLISQCELLNPLTSLQHELETARLAGLCANLVDAVVPLEEPQPAIYHLLKHTLQQLSGRTEDVSSLRIHFMIRLLRLAGFQPQLDECTSCNARIHLTGYWSVRQGGLLCPRCLHEDPKAELITPPMLIALETLLDSDLPVPIDPTLIQPLRQRLDEFLHWRLERPLKTLATSAQP